MSKTIFSFPTGFLWGCATASHQVEGNNRNNNWYAWENQSGRIINNDRSGLACDWWEGARWKEDFENMSKTGQSAHRLSLEWSRIQPSPHNWNDDALIYYREMIKALVDRNIIPMVTLHHFSDPLWLAEIGGWENEETPQFFSTYVRKVVGALKDYVTLWCTINEPNVYTYSGYIDGTFPPGKSNMKSAYNVMRNMLLGHAKAYHAIHELQPHCRVGYSINYRSFYPSREKSLLDRYVAGMLSGNFNSSFSDTIVDGKFNFLFKRSSIPEAIGTTDFIGLNYYTRDLVRFKFSPATFFNQRYFPPEAAVSDTGFIANVPEGMTEAIKWAHRYHLPIFITENGIEDSNDILRPLYLTEHLHKIWQAVNYNIPIKGYFHWSLIDNFEWERGWTQRFGLWGLDNISQKRIRRSSVDLYADICHANGISSDCVEKYTPIIYRKLFPE